VLQLDPETPVEQIKKKYRSLSMLGKNLRQFKTKTVFKDFFFKTLVHPDKNQDDKDRAQTAFEIINKSWKVLENDITRKKCLDVYEEAKDRTDFMIAEKKKKLKKDGRTTEVIPEDDPQKYKHAVYVMVMKLFADMERRRQQLDTRDMEERKRKREHEIDEEEAHKMNKEWQKNFEVKNLLVITLKSSLYFFFQISGIPSKSCHVVAHISKWRIFIEKGEKIQKATTFIQSTKNKARIPINTTREEQNRTLYNDYFQDFTKYTQKR
jgi:hypothetical protein